MKHLTKAVPGYWKLNRTIMQMSEEEIQYLLKLEKSHLNRALILTRLYGRLSVLRKIREKGELLGKS
jgi:hypothetical protein